MTTGLIMAVINSEIKAADIVGWAPGLVYHLLGSHDPCDLMCMCNGERLVLYVQHSLEETRSC